MACLEKYGKLVRVSDAVRTCSRKLGIYKCECGETKVIRDDVVKAGSSKSCGCERTRLKSKQGGGTVTEAYTYASWSAMIRRCEDKRSKWYPRYGARGISVYFDWLGIGGFANFLRDMGPRPPDKTLDRYPDCNGNYGPDNCRWATAREQRVNQERHQPWTSKNLRKNNP